MKKLVLVFLATASVWSAMGCNTVHGMGRDIEKGGEAIQKATK